MCPSTPQPPTPNFGRSVNPISTMGADYALNITSCPHRIFNPSYGPESLSSRLMMLAWYSNFLDPLLRITYYTTELYYQHSSSTNLATATLSFIIFHTEQYKKLSIRWVLLRWMLSMITIFILQCCLDFYGSVMIKNCSILSSKIPKSWSRVRLSVTRLDKN